MTQSAMSFKGTTALVTGGAGVIGTHLVGALLREGARVVVLDDFSAPALMGNHDRDGVRIVRGDVRDEQAITDAFAAGIDFVFHLAALFANERSIERPQDDLLVNGLGTLTILQHAASNGVRRFVYASSSSVYGAGARIPVREDAVSLAPGTPYHATKLLGELYAKYFNDSSALATVSVRIFNAYGPGELPDRYRNVVPKFIWLALKGRPLQITGTGEETRDFTYVADVVEGLLSAARVERATGLTFNVGSGEDVTIGALAQTILSVTDSDSPIEYTSQRSWDRVHRRRADIEQARRVLGYDPQWPLTEGIRHTVAWFRAHEPEIDERLLASR